MTLISYSVAICLIMLGLYLRSYPPFYVRIDNIEGFNGKWRVISVHEDAFDDNGPCFKLRGVNKIFRYSNTVILLGFTKDVFYIQKEQFETHRAKGRRWEQLFKNSKKG